MKNVLLIICFFLLTLNLIYAVENLDVINLKDGTTLKGEILETNNDFVIIKTSLGEIKIEKEKIKVIRVIIYLKDGNIIKGNLIKKNETSVNIETSLGGFEIELDNIKKMIEETDNTESSNTDLTAKTNNDTEIGIKDIGNALLYQQRQKKISTAIGFQALGAGLLYSEKYTMGTIMLLAENGLLISGAFVNDPEIVPYLWISGIALKAINTFFTIKSVNDYNNKLAVEMGIVDDNEIRFKSRKGYFYIAPSAGLGFDIHNDIIISNTIGYGSNSFGRIGSNITWAFVNESVNITIQYEKPILISKKSSFTPKVGLGSNINSYGDGKTHERDVYLGFVLGSAYEIELSKQFIMKLGYDHFVGLGPGSNSYGGILVTSGIKF